MSESSLSESPCLSLAIEPLTAAEPDHYAIWVWQAPYPAGHVLHDRLWLQPLTQAWHTWHNIFSLRSLPDVPRVPNNYDPQAASPPLEPNSVPISGQPTNYTGLLMQHLGVSLWQWLFDGSIQNCFQRSQGISQGQGRPLRLRLEVRDPKLIALPWEIMQPPPGMQAVSLSQQILFSRTTSAVDSLRTLRVEQSLKILLVLGQNADIHSTLTGSLPFDQVLLRLEQEAAALAQILESAAQVDSSNSFTPPVPCQVKTLLQPTPTELIAHLETESYNVLFYSGHGVPAPDGGLLFLRAGATLNGMELAQVLTRCQVKLAVFNACWGAQPDHQNGQPIPRSSLAEVLIHHGVPAVLGMRDSITDGEATSFIQVFAQALAERSPIDEAVAIARQNLLTLYHFNQPAWTLPVLYMHPEYNGELIQPLIGGVTEIPENSPSWIGRQTPSASLRLLTGPPRTHPINRGIVRIGNLDGNDLVLRGPGVSRRHAEIFYRDSLTSSDTEPTYYLKDFSRYGTRILGASGWYTVHQDQVPLRSKTRLKFGSFEVEFVTEG